MHPSPGDIAPSEAVRGDFQAKLVVGDVLDPGGVASRKVASELSNEVLGVDHGHGIESCTAYLQPISWRLNPEDLPAGV